MFFFPLHICACLLSNSISSPINTLPLYLLAQSSFSLSLSLSTSHTILIIDYRKPISQITLIDPNSISFSSFILQFSFGSFIHIPNIINIHRQKNIIVQKKTSLTSIKTTLIDPNFTSFSSFLLQFSIGSSKFLQTSSILNWVIQIHTKTVKIHHRTKKNIIVSRKTYLINLFCCFFNPKTQFL